MLPARPVKAMAVMQVSAVARTVRRSASAVYGNIAPVDAKRAIEHHDTPQYKGGSAAQLYRAEVVHHKQDGSQYHIDGTHAHIERGAEGTVYRTLFVAFFDVHFSVIWCEITTICTAIRNGKDKIP